MTLHSHTATTTNTVRLINGRDVRRLLSVEACTNLMRNAFLLAADKRTEQPIRTSVHQGDRSGVLSIMPGYIPEPETLGIKVVTVFPGNFGTRFGSHQGMLLLFDCKHGAPVAVLDGREVTAIRTAAATAVATDLLARSDASTLAIFGYGEQAHNHLRALLAVRDFREILIWGRNASNAKQFAAESTTIALQRIRVVADPQEAGGADVVCLTTSAKEAVFHEAWLRPGQHLNVVGSSIPTASEIDVQTVARGRFFVDLKTSALALAGDFRQAMEAGLVDADHIAGSIGDVLNGTVSGRETEEQITIFKSLGMISEDLVAADFILSEARRHNIGELIEW